MSRDRVWLYLIAFLILATAIGGAVLFFKRSNLQPVEIKLSQRIEPEITGRAFVSGAVANPGAYALNGQDTLATVLSGAGLAADADLNSVRVYVPSKAEAARPQRIDINRADAWLLEVLPGIGETRAKAIMDYRAKNGPFRTIDDLLKVSGISKSTLERIAPLITVGE